HPLAASLDLCRRPFSSTALQVRRPGSLASRRSTPAPPLDHHRPSGLSRSRASALSPPRLLVGHRSDCRYGSSAPSLLLSLGSRSRSEGRKRSARCRPGSSLVQTSRLAPACFSCRLLRHASVGRHPMLWPQLDHGFASLASLAHTQAPAPRSEEHTSELQSLAYLV